MEAFFGWMRGIVVYLCLLNLVIQILPTGNFKKYVRLFGGLLLLVLVLSPVGEWLSAAEDFEQIFWVKSLQNELEEMKITGEGLAELREEAIYEGYEAELEHQVEETARTFGLTAKEVQVTLGSDGQGITEIVVTLAGAEEGQAESLEKKLVQVYGIDESHIHVRG